VILPLVLGFCSRGPSVVSAPRTCRSELFLVSTASEENPARVARLCLFLARVSRSSHGFDFRAASCCPVSVLGCVRSGLVRKQEAAQPVWFCVLLGCQYEVLQLFLVSTAGEENPAHVARLSLFLARVSRSSHRFDFRAASCCTVSVLGWALVWACAEAGGCRNLLGSMCCSVVRARFSSSPA
jgi:hypothetical protein